MARWQTELSQYVEEAGLQADGWPKAPGKQYTGTRMTEHEREHKQKQIPKRAAAYERWKKRYGKAY